MSTLDLVDSPIKPRYDDVYFEGLKWLDEMAKTDFEELDHKVIDENFFELLTE